MDWWGLGALTIALLSMQYVLEEGVKDSWFQDDAILWLTVAAVIGGVFFVWRQLTYRQPIVSLKPFGVSEQCLGFADLLRVQSLFRQGTGRTASPIRFVAVSHC